MQHASPASRISAWTFLLVVVFVGASMAYAFKGFTDLATAALGAATVIAGGGGVTAAVVHTRNGKGDESGEDDGTASAA